MKNKKPTGKSELSGDFDNLLTFILIDSLSKIKRRDKA